MQIRIRHCVAGLLTGMFCLLLSSCSKDNEDSGSMVGFVFYDYYTIRHDFTNPNSDTVENYRVCYDPHRNRVVWQIPNEHRIDSRYIDANGKDYLHSFSIGENFIRIFPSAVATTLPRNVTGIYFQSISKKTGQAVVSKLLLAPGEFDPAKRFSISEVVTDGSNFYFSCNNGFVYCYDANGNQVWKKGGYTFADTWPGNYQEYGYVYLNSGKLYFHIVQPPSTVIKLVQLNASTGATDWIGNGFTGYRTPNVLFTDKYLIQFDTYKSGLVLNRATGATNNIHFAQDGPAWVRIIAGSSSAKKAYYITPAGHLGLFQSDFPDDATHTVLNEQFDVNTKWFGESEVMSFNTNPGWKLLSIDAPREQVMANKTWTLPPYSLVNGGMAIEYTMSKNSLFLLSTHHIDGSNVIVNTPLATGSNLCLINIDPRGGGVMSQRYDLPGGSDRGFRWYYYLHIE